MKIMKIRKEDKKQFYKLLKFTNDTYTFWLDWHHQYLQKWIKLKNLSLVYGGYKAYWVNERVVVVYEII